MKKFYKDPEFLLKKFSFDELLTSKLQNPSEPENDGGTGVDPEGEM